MDSRFRGNDGGEGCGNSGHAMQGRVLTAHGRSRGNARLEKGQ
jgi:hypothetical protein